jgi:hypothetical protein
MALVGSLPKVRASARRPSLPGPTRVRPLVAAPAVPPALQRLPGEPVHFDQPGQPAQTITALTEAPGGPGPAPAPSADAAALHADLGGVA